MERVKRVTDKPFVSLKRNTNKSNKIYNLLCQDKFKDLEFICVPQYESVKAHSLILSAYSPLIKQLYQTKKQFGSNLKFFLLNTKPIMVEYVLKLVYKGNVNVPEEDLPNFYKVCDQLKMRDVVLDNRGEPEVILSNSEQAPDNNNNEEEVTVSISKRVQMDVPQFPSDTEKDTGKKTRKLYDFETAAVKGPIVEPQNKRLLPQPSTSKDRDSLLRYNQFAEQQIKSKVVRIQKKSDKKKTVPETNPDKNSYTSTSKDTKHDRDKNSAPNCRRTVPDIEVITIESDSNSTDSDLAVQQPVKKIKSLDTDSDPMTKLKKKYNKLLSASNYQFKNFLCSCVLCNRMCKDIIRHVTDNHRKVRLMAHNECEKCRKTFFSCDIWTDHDIFCEELK